MKKIRLFLKWFLQWFFKHQEVIETHMEMLHNIKKEEKKVDNAAESTMSIELQKPAADMEKPLLQEQKGNNESCQY